MDQSRGNTGQPTTPWWYRIPKYPFGAITSCLGAIVIYTWFSQSVIVWVAGGAVTSLVAGFMHGMAQGAYNVRHRQA
jgi:hypothetical protein